MTKSTSRKKRHIAYVVMSILSLVILNSIKQTLQTLQYYIAVSKGSSSMKNVE
jgi:hypothetical protein